MLFRNTIPKNLFTCPLSCLCHIKSKQRSSNHKRKSDSLLMINIILSVKRAGKNEVEEAKEADIKRPSFLAPDKECKAIFWLTPCLTMFDILVVHKGQSVVFWPPHVWQGYILTYTMAIGIILAADKEHSTILWHTPGLTKSATQHSDLLHVSECFILT